MSSSPRCVTVGGLSVHAEVGVPARDRRRLQRLCRYTGRPPVATQRLSRLGEGRLLYRLKRRWRDGTTHVVLEPLELLEKLAALVPPPRIHQVRYHGILGPAVVSPSVRRPSSRSAWMTQFRIDGADTSYYRDSDSGVLPARTSSTNRRRYSGGYRRCVLAIVNSFLPKDQVSTKAGQLHSPDIPERYSSERNASIPSSRRP